MGRISDEIINGSQDFKEGYLQGVLDSQKKREEVRERVSYQLF